MQGQNQLTLGHKMKIWIWIKNLFKPKRVSPDITSVKPKVDLTGLTKGDIKKLKKQGKI